MKSDLPLVATPVEPQELGRVAPEARVGSADSSWLHSCYRLRYQYFVDKRGWVNPNDITGKLEIDRYDAYSHHVAVFEGEQPLSYLRALPCGNESGIMLDREFASILLGTVHKQLEREGAVELSRLAVAPQLRSQRTVWQIHPIEHLLKALYHLALERNYSLFYIVVEEGWPQVFARRFGLPFKVIGESHTFPDGTRTVAATATLTELEDGMRRHSTAKYDWYQLRSDE